MRNNQETEYTEHTDEELLEELSNCGILYIGHDEESNKDEFELCGSVTYGDGLYFTRDELKRLGFAIVKLAEEKCIHCDEEEKP